MSDASPLTKEEVVEYALVWQAIDGTNSTLDAFYAFLDKHPRLTDRILATIDERDREIAALKAKFTAPIVCICGSTRFKQAWIAENARLTGEGHIVLAVGLWGHHERVFPSPEQKAMLDAVHKRKIDLCDWVWVLDVDGYIGESTRSEIAYAEKLGRPIRYLSQKFPGYREPVDPLRAEVDRLTRERDEARHKTFWECVEIVSRCLASELSGFNGLPALSYCLFAAVLKQFQAACPEAFVPAPDQTDTGEKR